MYFIFYTLRCSFSSLSLFLLFSIFKVLHSGLPTEISGSVKEPYCFPSMADRLKISTQIGKTDSQLQIELGLVWELNFLQSTNNGTTQKDKILCSIFGPGNLYRLPPSLRLIGTVHFFIFLVSILWHEFLSILGFRLSFTLYLIRSFYLKSLLIYFFLAVLRVYSQLLISYELSFRTRSDELYMQCKKIHKLF